MLQVGFEPTTPVFERVKTVHALDSAATVMGINIHEYDKVEDTTEKKKRLCKRLTNVHKGKCLHLYVQKQDQLIREKNPTKETIISFTLF
jgi:hypothetical protein